MHASSHPPTYQALEEVNPMLGLRGCRLGLLFPELVEMQTRAVIHGAAASKVRLTPTHQSIEFRSSFTPPLSPPLTQTPTASRL